MNVVCPSFETYIEFFVEYQELVSAPGTVAAARFIACSIAALFVASPIVWKTTTSGGRTPTPNASSVRWLASYAGFPGLEKLWYQRLDSLPAAMPPTTVRTIHAAITSRRRLEMTRARRASAPPSSVVVGPVTAVAAMSSLLSR